MTTIRPTRHLTPLIALAAIAGGCDRPSGPTRRPPSRRPRSPPPRRRRRPRARRHRPAVPRRHRGLRRRVRARQRLQRPQGLSDLARKRAGDLRLRRRRPARPVFLLQSQLPALGSVEGDGESPLSQPRRPEVRGRDRPGEGRIPRLLPRRGRRRRERRWQARSLPHELRFECPVPEQRRRHLPRRLGRFRGRREGLVQRRRSSTTTTTASSTST